MPKLRTSAIAPRSLGRDYLYFWSGQSVSFIGTEVTLFSLPLIAVLSLHEPPTDLGLLFAARQLPSALLGGFVGVLVDRLPVRRLLIQLDFVRAGIVLLVPLLFYLKHLNFAALVCLTTCLGVTSLIFDIGYATCVPSLVDDDALTLANGRLEASYATAQIAGPALAAVMLSALEPPVALYLDAASYGVSVMFLRPLVRRETAGLAAEAAALRGSSPAGGSELRRYWPSVAAGFRMVWMERPLRVIALASSLLNFCSGALLALVAFYVVKSLGQTASGYAVATAVGSIGAVLAALGSGRIEARLGTWRHLFVGLVCSTLGTGLLASVPSRETLTLVLVSFSQMLVGFGITAYAVTSLTLRQRLAPKDLRGAIFGAMRMISRAGVPAGAVAAGLVATYVSTRAALAAAAVGNLAVMAIVLVFRSALPTPATTGAAT